MKIIFVFLLINMFVIQNSWAQSFSFFNREQITTLPKNRMIVSDVGFQSEVNSQYNYKSDLKNLSDNLNRRISFNDIIKDEKIRGSQLTGMFQANDVDLNDSAGSVSGEIKTLVDGHVPVFGYGITDRISVIVSVPMIHFTMNSNYRFTNSAATNNFLTKLQQQDQNSVAQDFKKAFQYSLETKLSKIGYKWNSQVDQKFVGDTQIYILQKISEQEMLSGILILPTADQAKMDDLFELKGGDRKWGLGAKYAIMNTYDNGISLSHSVQNILLLPTTQEKRLYLTADNDLKEGIDLNTQSSFVDQIKYQFQVRYEFPTWLGVTAGYNWQYKTAEQFSGSKYEASVYDLNGSRTAEELKSIYFATDINSIKSFLSKNFIIPMALELGTSIPVGGKNAMAQAVYQLQGSLFF